MIELLKDTISAIPVMLTDGLGGLVTNVLKAQVDPYYKKSGGLYVQLPASHFDWFEEDSANTPGQYALTINATGVAGGVLDTEGAFLVTIKANVGPPAFVSHPSLTTVSPREYWDQLQRIIALVGFNFRIFPTAWDLVTNEPTAATMRIYKNAADAAANVNHITELTITAIFNGLGQLTSYQSVE